MKTIIVLLFVAAAILHVTRPPRHDDSAPYMADAVPEITTQPPHISGSTGTVWLPTIITHTNDPSSTIATPSCTALANGAYQCISTWNSSP